MPGDLVWGISSCLWAHGSDVSSDADSQLVMNVKRELIIFVFVERFDHRPDHNQPMKLVIAAGSVGWL